MHTVQYFNTKRHVQAVDSSDSIFLPVFVPFLAINFECAGFPLFHYTETTGGLAQNQSFILNSVASNWSN